MAPTPVACAWPRSTARISTTFRGPSPKSSERDAPFRFFALTALLALGQCPVPVQAWGNHTLASYRALENLPEVSAAAPVAVESLDRFLNRRKHRGSPIGQPEAWAASNLSHYPTRPAALAFKADPNRSGNCAARCVPERPAWHQTSSSPCLPSPDPRLPAPVAARLAYADVSTRCPCRATSRKAL